MNEIANHESIETVSGEKVITDGTMTVNLYAVSGRHTETMLIAYFPRERLLVEADVCNPGNAVQAFGAGFLEQVKLAPTTRRFRAAA